MKRLASLILVALASACATAPTGPAAAVTTDRECLEWRTGVIQTPVGPLTYSYCVRWSDEQP